MKRKNIIQSICIMTLCSAAYAQQAPKVVNPDTYGVSGVATPPPAVTTSEILANVDSTDHTIQQLGKVQSRLEYVKLLKDLKQAEYDLKAPIEKKDASGSARSELAPSSGVPFNPVRSPEAMPQTVMVTEPDFSNVAVYSVVGFDNQYSAKVSLDGRSTYTVRKGDTLPNGSIVTDLTRYYIVLSEKSAVGRPLAEPKRIYVTGKPLPSATGNSIPTSNVPNSIPSNPIGATSNLVIPGQRMR